MIFSLRTGRDMQLLSFPFVLSTGDTVELRLPKDGLVQADADRLKAYIDSLVISTDD